MDKLNITKHECSCGAEVDEYDTVNDKGEIVHHGYPETYCHCNCGAKWGEHVDHKSIISTRQYNKQHVRK